METSRIEYIRNRLLEDKKVKVSELSVLFDVTEETIRRDLKKLEDENFANRTYGGAVLNSRKMSANTSFYVRLMKNNEKKKIIAEEFRKVVGNNKTILADASTTVFNAIKKVKNMELTVVSNSVELLKEVSDGNITYISTGGVLDKKTMSFSGSITNSIFKRYNTDFAVVSCKGIDISTGITDSNDFQAHQKNIMIKQAKKVILLVDSSKFDEKGFVQVADAARIDMLITDKKPNKEWLEYFSEKNISVIYPMGNND
ncbi:DeoR/GlpR family DNA-binding transcription regulator [Ligilactobacillus salivarius]|uniref:DeoR/GlpR family DNA-binding transcription regulator n=1 Tax=Ligilactobacillus salivarius TaxID=1624 RepID=UPI00117AFF69|nr:DeoR/GlpR family DNA-binding transcription regulator [Ligilactobacillus salivarius]